MPLTGEELVIDGQQVDARIDGSLTQAYLTRRYDGATSLDLTVADNDMALLAGPRLPNGDRGPAALTRPGQPSKKQDQFTQAAWDRFATARLNLDGVSFMLAGSEGNYDSLPWSNTITFEDEMATIMRRRTEATKVSRGQDTRAEFNRRLVQAALRRADVPFNKQIADRFFSPQAGQRQPQAEPDKEDGREKGFAKGKHLTVKGVPATAEQKRNMEIALTVADQLRAGERATLALIDAGITESQWVNLSGGDADSEGVLQVQKRTAVTITPRTVIDPRSGNTHGTVTSDATGRVASGKLDPRDVKAVCRVFLLSGYTGAGGAIKYATDNPDAEIYEIAQAIQGSGAGRASDGAENYGPWVEEAKKILEAWGGTGTVETLRESYEFRAGGRRSGRLQNYWDDSGNSAEDVAWRRFADRNRVWFVADNWLFKRKPTFYVDATGGGGGGPNVAANLAAQGIIGISYQADIGLPVAEIQVECFLPRWGGPPGAVFEFDNLGPLTGRWLIAVNRMNLLASPETATLTLRRPAPKKKEPAPNTNTRVLTETRPEAGSAREAIVAAARKALKLKSNYFYVQKRPMHDSLFENEVPAGTAGPAEPMGIDCSEFATLVYKAAGVKDPNGSSYDGSGYTGTLAANGTKTSDPQPGDLVLYKPPAPYGHVAVYIGNGKAIGIGGSAGVREHDAKERADFAGYWTYDLGDA